MGAYSPRSASTWLREELRHFSVDGSHNSNNTGSWWNPAVQKSQDLPFCFYILSVSSDITQRAKRHSTEFGEQKRPSAACITLTASDGAYSRISLLHEWAADWKYPSANNSGQTPLVTARRFTLKPATSPYRLMRYILCTLLNLREQFLHAKSI